MLRHYLSGLTNNNVLYTQADGLMYIFGSLPPGLFGFDDATYTLSEHMLIPFTEADRLDPADDAFNYDLSQLPIHVNMAFGDS